MNKLTCRNTNTGRLSHICSSRFKLYLINLITNQYLTLLFSFSVSLSSRLSPHHSPCLSRLPLGPEAQGRAMLSAVDVDHLKQKTQTTSKRTPQKEISIYSTFKFVLSQMCWHFLFWGVRGKRFQRILLQAGASDDFGSRWRKRKKPTWQVGNKIRPKPVKPTK